MEDLFLILILLLAGFLLVKYLSGGSSSNVSNGGAPYASEIGKAANSAVSTIETVVSNTIGSLGKLAANTEQNFAQQTALTVQHSSTMNIPSQQTLTEDIKKQLGSSNVAGPGLTTTPTALAASGAGAAIPVALASFLQGAVSGGEAAGSLPAVKALGNGINWLGSTMSNGLDSAIGGAINGANDARKWVANLF